MKIGIISKSIDFWTTSQIMEAVKKRSLEPVYIHTPRIHLTLKNGKADAVYEHLSISNLDVTIPRIGRSLTQLGLMLLRHFELMNVPSTLSLTGLLTARNKYHYTISVR